MQGDLVLMAERDDRLVVGGGSVCFPNRWDLRSKLGRTMAEVHEPVSRLNEQLAPPIDSVLAEHLTLDDIHLRVERETLRRVPETGCVLSTIRTHLGAHVVELLGSN